MEENKPVKRYFLYRSSLVRKCRGIETERIRDIIAARTKKEAKEKFSKKNNGRCAQVCVEVTESEEELSFRGALDKYDGF